MLLLEDLDFVIVATSCKHALVLGMSPGNLPDGTFVHLEGDRLLVLAIFECRDLKEAIAVARGQASSIKVELAVVNVVLVIGLNQLKLGSPLVVGIAILLLCVASVHHVFVSTK